jgi:hypothetical protein
MIGKIVGAVAGKRLAQRFGGMSGPGGALLGVGAAAVARRMGPVGLVAALVGGWAVKRHMAKREATAGPNKGPSRP